MKKSHRPSLSFGICMVILTLIGGFLWISRLAKVNGVDYGPTVVGIPFIILLIMDWRVSNKREKIMEARIRQARQEGLELEAKIRNLGSAS